MKPSFGWTSRASLSDARARIVAILAASSGNLVEWFDFYIYSYFALVFSPSFFPDSDQTTQLLKSAGIFAVGFLMRPIGGWVFGRLADRHGRKRSMVISVSMMCGGSLLIACLPTYAQIGVWAPVLLLLARLIQGLSVGGEYGTTATYMSEVALGGQRGFYSSFQYVTLIGGQLLALLVVVTLQYLLDERALAQWGWRIPFFMGALGAVTAMLLRKTLRETSSEHTRHTADAGSVRSLWREHRRAFITVFAYTAGGSLSFYTFTTFMQKYLVNSAGMPVARASAVMTVCLLLAMLMQPLFGALSDRIGRRTNLLLFSGAVTVLTVPVLTTLKSVSSPLIAGALITTILAAVSLYTSVSGVVKAEAFPPEVRALGVGLSYGLANALFGGSAEYVALALKSAGHESTFAWYVTGMLAITFAVCWRLPRHATYLRDEP